MTMPPPPENQSTRRPGAVPDFESVELLALVCALAFIVWRVFS
jgi:hypothetical protein